MYIYYYRDHRTSLRRDSSPVGAPLTPPMYPSTLSRGPTFSPARTYHKSSGRAVHNHQAKPSADENRRILLHTTILKSLTTAVHDK